MRKSLILASALLAVLALFTLAPLAAVAQAPSPLSPQAQYSADSKAAAARYAKDKALCADEVQAAPRLQCRRDARAAYDLELSQARARRAAALPLAPAAQAAPAPASASVACATCGRVLSVTKEEKSGEGTPLGLIAGGVAGAILGNQVGSGTGKDLATIAGAAGGAYAGKKIEEKATSQTVWTVSVRFGDGSKGSYTFVQDPCFQTGDAVRKSGQTIVR